MFLVFCGNQRLVQGLIDILQMKVYTCCITLPKRIRTQKHPLQLPRWPFDFARGIKAKLKKLRVKNSKKLKFVEPGELSKHFLDIKLNHLHYSCCCLGYNPKLDGSNLPPNFDVQVPNILVTCLCPTNQVIVRHFSFLCVWGNPKLLEVRFSF